MDLGSVFGNAQIRERSFNGPLPPILIAADTELNEDGLRRLEAITLKLIGGLQPTEQEYLFADEVSGAWTVHEQPLTLREFESWLVDFREFLVAYSIGIYDLPSDSSAAYEIPFQELRLIPEEGFDSYFGDNSYRELIKLYEANQREVFRRAFSHLHALLDKYYMPGADVRDAYAAYLTEADPQATKSEALEMAYRSLWYLQSQGLADASGHFVTVEEAFDYWGIELLSGAIQSEGRAAKYNDDIIHTAMSRVGAVSSSRFVSSSSSRLIGGGSVKVVADRGQQHLLIKDGFDQILVDTTTSRALNGAEQELLQAVLIPLKPWIICGSIGPPVLISFFTAGSVGVEISTHGVGIDVGLPGTQLGPVGIGPSAGVRYGFEKPLFFNTPLLPGINWHLNLGVRSSNRLVQGGTFINYNSTYDYTLAGVSAGLLGYINAGYDVLQGTWFGNSGPLWAIRDPVSKEIHSGMTLGAGVRYARKPGVLQNSSGTGFSGLTSSPTNNGLLIHSNLWPGGTTIPINRNKNSSGKDANTMRAGSPKVESVGKTTQSTQPRQMVSSFTHLTGEDVRRILKSVSAPMDQKTLDSIAGPNLERLNGRKYAVKVRSTAPQRGVIKTRVLVDEIGLMDAVGDAGVEVAMKKMIAAIRPWSGKLPNDERFIITFEHDPGSPNYAITQVFITGVMPLDPMLKPYRPGVDCEPFYALLFDKGFWYDKRLYVTSLPTGVMDIIDIIQSTVIEYNRTPRPDWWF